MISIYLVTIIFISGIASAQSPWTRKADFPGYRYQAVAFNIAEKGYAGTGSSPNAYMDDLWEYDPGTNKWEQKASLPGGGRTGAFAFSINNKGYIGGGARDTITFYDFWEYDPVENEWTKKADIPLGFHFPGTLVAFSIGGKGYLRGSFGEDIFSFEFWEFDPVSNSWTKKAKFPGKAHLDAIGFSIDDKGYIGIGFDGFNATSDLWEYNPSEDEWVQKEDFSGMPRIDAVAFVINSKGYVGMGNAQDVGIVSDFWAYDPSTDSWTQIDSCGYAAEGGFAFSIGSKGYVGTGLFSSEGDFWEYDPNITSVNSDNKNNIKDFILKQNYPNPFNPVTTINYILAENGFVTLDIYDILGNKIKRLVNEYQTKGDYQKKFDAEELSSGMYIYQLKINSYISSKKMILLK